MSQQVKQLAGDPSMWEVRSAGAGSKGQRWYAWAWIATVCPHHQLLVRRHLRTGELAFHYCYVPAGQPLTKTRLIRAAGLRWPVEEDFELGKDCFGLDQCQAEEIKQRLARFLRDNLKLELSADKTLVTHARTQAAKFLGYEITVLHNDRKVSACRRTVNGTISLRVPTAVIKAKSAPYLVHGKPERRSRLSNEDDHTIVNTYAAEYRGIVQYYLLAGNVDRLYRLHWVMETSLLKTLANKYRSSVSKMARKYKTTTDTPHGPRKCMEARIERGGRKPLVARFGGIPLRRQRDAAITDRLPAPGIIRHKELVTRLLANRCEICRNTDGISVHHVRRLADLHRPGQPQPAWAQQMARRRRKTLVVCRTCHDAIHTGQPTPHLTQ